MDRFIIQYEAQNHFLPTNLFFKFFQDELGVWFREQKRKIIERRQKWWSKPHQFSHQCFNKKWNSQVWRVKEELGFRKPFLSLYLSRIGIGQNGNEIRRDLEERGNWNCTEWWRRWWAWLKGNGSTNILSPRVETGKISLRWHRFQRPCLRSRLCSQDPFHRTLSTSLFLSYLIFNF